MTWHRWRSRIWYARMRWRRHGLLVHPRRTCYWCGIPVWISWRQWNRTARGRVYCSRLCRSRQGRLATPAVPAPEPTLELEPLPPARPCPTPLKFRFHTRAQAAEHFAHLLAADPTLELYPCVCAYWHAGHPRGTLRPRAKPVHMPLSGPLSEEHQRLLSELARALEDGRDA